MVKIDASSRTKRQQTGGLGRCLLVLLLACLGTAPLMARFYLSTPSSAPTQTDSSSLRGNSATDNNLPGTQNPGGEDPSQNAKNTVMLTLQLDDQGTTATVRLNLFAEEAPEAARYLQELATSSPSETCKRCTLYRGEPVPDYWGSEEYPDRYFDGGRWGPPYALVQGRLVPDDPNNQVPKPPAEPHRPVIKRGMVAWAGGGGGPDFFIALAQHPEWGTEHTVFAQVEEEDMGKVDALLTRPLVLTKPKQPPIVSNFVDPIPISIATIKGGGGDGSNI